MNAAKEIQTEESLEKIVKEKNPVSVYSVSFAPPIISDEEKEFLMSRVPVSKIIKRANQSNLSKAVFNRRNAAIAAAIITIGILHFAFQVSFINSEISENRPVAEVPPVKTEPASSQIIEIPSNRFETENAVKSAPVKPAVPVVRKLQLEPAPIKPQMKKKESFETSAERLRRVEKALTGV